MKELITYIDNTLEKKHTKADLEYALEYIKNKLDFASYDKITKAEALDLLDKHIHNYEELGFNTVDLKYAKTLVRSIEG